jgi:hypothetical protein
LLLPALAKTHPFPRPEEHSAEGRALTALVRFCTDALEPPTTAAVLQAFAESAHAALFADILATDPGDPLDDVALEAEVRGGLDRWWQQERRKGRPAPASETETIGSEEARRLAALDFVRSQSPAEPGLGMADLTDGHGAEGPRHDII